MGKARDYIPALKYGHKIMPEDLAGLIGLPHIGDVFYVDPTAGSDTANSGTSQDDALKTVAAAFDKCTGGQHDVVIIAPTGGTGRTSETTAINWNKRYTHLIGSAAPVTVNVPAGITFASGGSLIISENGCLFKSLTFTSSADIDETISVTGNRNAFIGCDFKGTSNATSADSTPWRALNLQGEENEFTGCTFGADTMTRGVANATLELESGAIRNVFTDCRFVMHADTATTQLHVLITGSSGVDRYTEFKDCLFYAFFANHSSKVAAVFNFSAQTATYDVLMTGNNLAVGFTDWEGSATNFVWFPQFTATAANVGLPINNA